MDRIPADTTSAPFLAGAHKQMTVTVIDDRGNEWLVEAHQSSAWDPFRDSITWLFHYEILPPDANGADISAECRDHSGEPRLDMASAGSGFQQVLRLLTFLHARPGSILLLDEPDAHLHVILQEAIDGE